MHSNTAAASEKLRLVLIMADEAVFSLTHSDLLKEQGIEMCCRTDELDKAHHEGPGSEYQDCFECISWNVAFCLHIFYAGLLVTIANSVSK